MKTIEKTDATASLASYAEHAEDFPIVITDHGRPIAALMPIPNADADTVSLSSNPEFLASLFGAAEGDKRGKGSDHRESCGDGWKNRASPGMRLCCLPARGGATENSPAIYRWGRGGESPRKSRRDDRNSRGQVTVHRPYGTTDPPSSHSPSSKLLGHRLAVPRGETPFRLVCSNVGLCHGLG